MENLEIALDFYDRFPEEYFNIEPHEIRSVFPHPSIVSLNYDKEETIFLSVFLHGNEQSSFYILKEVMSFIKKNPPSKNIIILIGNVYAAEQRKRYLYGQKDYNRVWQGGDSKEHKLSQKIFHWIKKQKPFFACIDIHNTTGVNPHYACINELDNRYIYLASLFSKTIVYFQTPPTTLSVALSKISPTVTLEAGQSRDPKGIEKAIKFVLNIFHLNTLNHPLHKDDVNIFHTIGKIQILPNLDFSFSDVDKIDPDDSPAIFPDNIEQLNFTLLNKGFCLARYIEEGLPIRLFDDNDVDQTSIYLSKKFHKILINQEVYPSMFTKSKEAIEQDCLGYFMRKLSISDLK